MLHIRRYHLSLVTCSAILYALSFVCNTKLWWLIFLFPIPILYRSFYKDLSYRDNVLWSIIAIGSHISGVSYALFMLAQGSIIERLIPSIIVGWYPIIIAFSFLSITTFCTQRITIKNRYCAVILWSITLLILFIFFDRFCLIFFGYIQGYQCFNPLTLLARYPPLLFLLPVIGKELLLALFFIPSIAISILAHKKNVYTICATIASFIPWILSIALFTIYETQDPQAPTINTIKSCRDYFDNHENIIDNAQAAAGSFKKIIQRSPETELIILPESSFNADISECNNRLSCWDKKYVGKKIHLLIGTFRSENANYYNSICWFYNGILQDFFDKRTPMILGEQLPLLLRFCSMRTILFGTRQEVSPSNNDRPCFTITDQIACVPYICSELFFNHYPDDQFPTVAILAICNDRHFLPYMHELLLLTAQSKAIEWRRDIMYISFNNAEYIHKSGKMVNL